MYKRLVLFFTLMIASQLSLANDMYFPYVSVVDGDTIRSSIQVACPLCNVFIRIRGIDTPETNHLAKCDKERQLGLEAKRHLQSMLLGKKEFLARNIQWDKYGGRILADVEIDGRSVAREMISMGYARPYAGVGRRPDWCR